MNLKEIKELFENEILQVQELEIEYKEKIKKLENKRQEYEKILEKVAYQIAIQETNQVKETQPVNEIKKADNPCFYLQEQAEKLKQKYKYLKIIRGNIEYTFLDFIPDFTRKKILVLIDNEKTGIQNFYVSDQSEFISILCPTQKQNNYNNETYTILK